MGLVKGAAKFTGKALWGTTKFAAGMAGDIAGNMVVDSAKFGMDTMAGYDPYQIEARRRFERLLDNRR